MELVHINDNNSIIKNENLMDQLCKVSFPSIMTIFFQ